MPDLTSARLIALLREHPLACGELEIEIDDDYFGDGSNDIYIGTCDSVYEAMDDGRPFRRWLTGALAEAHIERGMALPHGCNGVWLTHHDVTSKRANDWTYYPTLLHALLAGLESHLKETTK